MTKCEINGMYGFVLYDNKTDTYIVARDPIGIIPVCNLSLKTLLTRLCKKVSKAAVPNSFIS